MIESAELVAARKHLSRAEAALFSKEALFELEEGLAYLEELMDSGDADAQRLGHAIGRTYASKIYAAIGSLIATDRNVPEPTLEHLLRVIVILDAAGVDLPTDAREVKISLGRELLNRYLEGHAAEEKRAALEELMRIADGGSDGVTR